MNATFESDFYVRSQFTSLLADCPIYHITTIVILSDAIVSLAELQLLSDRTSRQKTPRGSFFMGVSPLHFELQEMYRKGLTVNILFLWENLCIFDGRNGPMHYSKSVYINNLCILCHVRCLGLDKVVLYAY
jgi:hypothetical protein